MRKKVKELSKLEKEKLCERHITCMTCPFHESSMVKDDDGFCCIDLEAYQDFEVNIDE